MDAVRWILILLAIGAAAAAALWMALSGPAASPTSAPQSTTVAALPLNLPAASTVPAAPASSPPARGASAAVAPVPAAKPAAPRVGSEGYGPYIDRAMASNDAAAAWEAMQWLQLCTSNADRRASFEQVRSMGVSPEMMTQLMQEADAEGRRCQTVTARHQAMLGDLALRAMRGGVREAAAKYAGVTPPDDLAPALRQEVLDTMRRDARSGHAGSLFDAVIAPDAWGLDDAEKLGYLFAYGELTGKQGKELVLQLMQQKVIRLKGPPTAEQLAAAKVSGQQIIETLRAKP
ncbi:hypothetical protein J2X20_002202 [Pelomonas saccharophila]|uniref:Uncharacterized protein n=1 Tax=Roseateles saccharophilus TaxID=304 RepID=A0ABU1YL34_ROSSA|nr:hypothetical protein [Roseateles saccharophilus]MDR7269573.1 hypothetical protein [Roseateles saccharophilus]